MRKVIIIILLSVISAVYTQARNCNVFGNEYFQRNEHKAIKFAYDINFEYNFDNREFDTGGNLYTNSMTINAARLTPMAGFKINEGNKSEHKVMLGIDILKNMGASPTNASEVGLENVRLFREMLLYYHLRAKTGHTIINGYAGIFPRRFAEGGYSNEFLSDSLKFFDNNIEGILLKFKRPKSIYELSCDWLGQFGSHRRERFIISSYGKTKIANYLSAGWTISYYHLANMVEYGGVVDNMLAMPFIRFGFETFAPLQTLSLKFSWLQGMQRDRIVSKKFDFPMGGQIDMKIMNWNVGIENKVYIGKSLMAYYNNIDAGGNKYGNLLYRGEPFYRIFPNKGDFKKIGVYDRLEIFYQPHISDYLDLKLSLFFHFAENNLGNISFAGSRQRLSLVFNLEKLISKNKAANNKNNRIILFGGRKYL